MPGCVGIDLFSSRDREKTINILELVRNCLLPGWEIPDYDQLWSIFWKCHEWQKSAQLNVTENGTERLNRKKKKRSSLRIIDGLMQRSTHKINTLPQPEITRTIISLPFNRAHFVKNELKQARVKILTVKRRENEVRSFQAILASSWDSNERRQSMPCRRGFHSFSCQILRCWRHSPPLPSPFLPKQSTVLFHVSRGLFLESLETSGATRERYQLVLYFWWFQRLRLKWRDATPALAKLLKSL